MVMSRLMNGAAALLVGFGVLQGAATPAEAGTIRFAYLKTISLMPFLYAEKKGYFKAAGIDLDMIAVPGGPAVGAAIASGSADMGYAAPTPIAIAREQGQPFRIFMALEWERTPDRLWGYMLAGGKSGVKSLKDLAGKSVVVGVPGGLCELTARDWLNKAGIDASQVKFLNNPFPQMPAMLEVGTADAACISDPYADAALHAKTPAVVLSRGYLADVRVRYRIEGLFATESWIAAHAADIATIKKVFLRATAELQQDPATVKQILDEEYRFPPSLAAGLTLYNVTEVEPVASEFQPVLDKMFEYKMLSKPMKGDDLIAKGS